MKILNELGKTIENPDLEKGFLRPDKLLIQHHESVPGVKEQGHMAVVHEYPNGGRDMEWVIDVPGREAIEAWDEYEDIQRYVLFTPEELALREERKKKAEKEARRLTDLEEKFTAMERAYQEGVQEA